MSQRSLWAQRKAQTPQERLCTLRFRLHLAVLKKLLAKEDKKIYIGLLERHEGRRRKAIRDLIEAGEAFIVTHNLQESSCWSDTLDRYLDEYIATAEAKPEEEVVKRHIKNIMGHTNYETKWQDGASRRSCTSLNLVGWKEISYEDIGNLAKVWAHKDEYLFLGYDEDKLRISTWEKCAHPKYFIHVKIYAQITKLVLRNIVECHAEMTYGQLSLVDTTLKGWSDHSDLDFVVRNVTAQEPHPSNVDAVISDCDMVLTHIKEYREACFRLKKTVEKYGGLNGYLREILKRSIKDLLLKAPIYLAENTETPSNSTVENSHNISAYVLSNANLMEYDLLFDDREGILKLIKHKMTKDSEFLTPAEIENVLGYFTKEIFIGNKKKEV